MKDRSLPQPSRSAGTRTLLICAVVGVLAAAVLYAQIPEATQAPPRWEYTVIRVVPPHPEGQLKLLKDRMNQLAEGGWQYAGLLSLEATRDGQNGIVLLRRLKL